MAKSGYLCKAFHPGRMFSPQEHYLSLSLAVYLATSIIVAAVRWGHRCRPYARHMDYYHPAWRAVVFCFLSNLVMAPAVFIPSDTDAVLQLRFLLFLASPFFCALVLFGYFGKVLGIGKWRRPVYVLAFPFGLMALTATVLALVPDVQMDQAFCRWFFSLGGVLALFFLACYVTALRMVIRALQRFPEENYSNPEDFPRQYAASVIWIPLLHLGVSWSAAFIGTPAALSVGLLVLSALAVVILIGALSPRRMMTVEQLEAGQAEVDDAAAAPEAAQDVPALSPERQEEIENAIRRYMEDGQAYMDSHLTLADLARGIGINRTYVSTVINDRMGGFFSYVNRCRYEHLTRLRAEQPDAPIGELIYLSGFSSRNTYYKIKKHMDEIALNENGGGY